MLGAKCFAIHQHQEKTCFGGISPKLFAIVSELCSEDVPRSSKTKPEPSINVWHLGVTFLSICKTFQSYFDLFYLQSCKSEERKRETRGYSFWLNRGRFHAGQPIVFCCPAKIQMKVLRRTMMYCRISHSALPGQGRRSRIHPADWKTRKIQLNALQICIKCTNM